ncbi:MAG TPA: FtsX-like permease family protein [Acidimicrobiales bacterium]|jgi:hypothetical protein|nr:FtsX-like permease family protein [Acidimicrobiales bacterium]
MIARAFVVAWYRFSVTLSKSRRSYLALALLVALLGGLSMGAISGARRTIAAFPSYLATTDSSNLQANIWNLQESLSGPATANIAKQLDRLSGVRHVASAPTMIVVPLDANGKPPAAASAIYGSTVAIVGSAGGMYFRQDRVSVARGRLANPRRADEMNATTLAANVMHWHVGETIDFGAFTPRQVQASTFSPSSSNALSQFKVKLVGLIVFTSEVAHDDVDRYPTQVLVTLALTRKLQSSETLPLYGLRLRHGDRDVARVEREIIHMIPKGTVYAFHVTSVVTGQVQRASKPEAFALAGFGAIAGLAALLLAGLIISRRLWEDVENLNVLRALGADPVTTTLDGAIGPLSSLVVGAVGAVGIAVLLSPLTLVGPIRQVERSPGFTFDWSVLAAGFAVLVLGLGALTLALAYRTSTRRIAERAEPSERRSGLINATGLAGLSVAASVGVRFAFQRGHGRTSVPVRSVLVGAVTAVVVVVATVTFASSLSTLNANPALYGWNWNYAIATGAGGSVPPIANRLLDHSRDVAAWAGFNFGDVEIDGQTVPELDGLPNAALSPPILSGHALEAKNQIVVGAATLAELHKKVGDTVYLSYGNPQNAPLYVPPTPLVVVGTATFPAVGTSGTFHPSMGIGVLFSTTIGSSAFQKAIAATDKNLNGPSIEFVRFRRGVSRDAARRALERISSAANKVLLHDPNAQGDATFVEGVQRPAEIVAYQSTGATPALLALGLVTGAVVALGLSLASSVRRRRRELALLKTLGFTQRQLAAAVSWQASVTAMVGVVAGVPIGVALGRWLWTLFARAIYAVPEPSVPVLQVVLIAVGALLVANLVASIPGRSAARTPASLVLRAE